MGKIIVPNRNIVKLGFHAHVGMEGYYGLKRINKFSGKIVQEIKPFHNLILDQGLLNYFGTVSDPIYGGDNILFNNGSMYGAVCVGTGNVTPQVSDVGLADWTATTWNPIGYNVTYVPAVSPIPAYWSLKYNYQFGTGIASGNLSEIGTFPSNSNISNKEYRYLSSRALIVDSNGNPTTITVLSDEILTATYEIRFYLDITDHAFTVNLNSSPITGVYRLCNITSPRGTVGWSIYNNGQDNISLYSGDIRSVTETPSGSILGSNSGPTTLVQIVNDISNTGTCYQDRTYTFPINTGNGTILSLVIEGIMWRYQFGNLSTPIVKTSGQQLQVNYRLSWGRYTP